MEVKHTFGKIEPIIGKFFYELVILYGRKSNPMKKKTNWYVIDAVTKRLSAVTSCHIPCAVRCRSRTGIVPVILWAKLKSESALTDYVITDGLCHD